MILLKKIGIFLALFYSISAQCFERDKPLISNIHLRGVDIGVVMAIVSSKEKKLDKFNYYEILQGKKLIMINEKEYKKKYFDTNKNLENFDEYRFVFTDRKMTDLKSTDGTVFKTSLIDCIPNEDFPDLSKCDALEIRYQSSVVRMSLKSAMRSWIVPTAIEKFNENFVIGTGFEGELQLLPEQAYSFNPKTNEVKEINSLGTKIFTVFRSDKSNKTIWIGTSSGVYQLDGKYNIIKYCPIDFVTNKEFEAKLMCP